MNAPYYLGCPIWASDDWRGRLFTASARRQDWLRQYSQVFNTVEGNSVFYGLPTTETAARWCEQTAEGFRFCLKFPRAISHDQDLLTARRDTEAFLEILRILHEGERLGPSFLQLSPAFGAARLPELKAYLKSLPPEFPYAVEVRHPDFHPRQEGDRELTKILRKRQVERVILDSRPLFSAPAETPDETRARGRKPRLPVRFETLGQQPFLRLIGRDNADQAQPWLEQWAPVIAGWIAEGRTPYVFAHSPNDAFAPDLARRFHQELRKHSAQLEPEAPWLGETSTGGQQLELFS